MDHSLPNVRLEEHSFRSTFPDQRADGSQFPYHIGSRIKAASKLAPWTTHFLIQDCGPLQSLSRINTMDNFSFSKHSGWQLLQRWSHVGTMDSIRYSTRRPTSIRMTSEAIHRIVIDNRDSSVLSELAMGGSRSLKAMIKNWHRISNSLF